MNENWSLHLTLLNNRTGQKIGANYPKNKYEILEMLDRCQIPYGSGDYAHLAVPFPDGTPDSLQLKLAGVIENEHCPPSIRQVNFLAEQLQRMSAESREALMQELTAGWTEAEFNAQIENTRSQITELREKISDAIIYISKRTELTFAPLKLNRVAISLYDIVKSTGERKDAFRFTYQAEGCTKGRLYKCLSHSERLRAGMEVSEMVKRLTGRNYPVFADDMESIEDLSNVKPTGQVIMARVVPHAPLSVQPLQPIQASAQAQAA